ncbi:MAG: AAA family ATPase [Anaerolineae bacterium]|nr:AAA family ATPase [Anaerolineae bacterium]
MGTLNTDLLSKDMDMVLNDVVELRSEFRHQSIQPELILLGFLRHPNTAAGRILKVFKDQRGVDLDRLERNVRRAAQSRRDQNGNLDFVARGNKKVPMSRQSIIMLDDALSIANTAHEVRIDTDHIMTVLAESSMSTSGLLRQEGITPKAIQDIYSDGSSSIIDGKQGGENIVKKGKRGNFREIHFREELLQEMISILTQRVHRHIILIGRAGVGKRSLAHSLGLVMAEGKGPRGLSNFITIGEKDLYDNEQQAIRGGLSRARDGILFIPHIHRFFGGPIKAEFNKSTSIVQKSFLDDDPVIICTTTDEEYNARIANVSSIVEHSQIIRVEETSVEETIEILQVNKPSIEIDYDIKIEDEALKRVANLARRYMAGTPNPLSAQHLIHRAAAIVSTGREKNIDNFRTTKDADGILDAEDVMIATSQISGIPVSKLGQDERERYSKMEHILKENIIGQDSAVDSISRAIKTARVGFKDPKRPIGTFLFLGPTGVGKTEMAKQLADFMFGSEDAIFPLDMSEFKDESSINRLIGSPTGYVGSEDGGQLTEKVRQQPYIIILFDEIEKAHPRIMDILLQVFEEGRLTDGRGVTTRFSDSVVILTSNIGSEYLSVPDLTEEIREQVWEDIKDPEISSLRPEFINRLDEVIMFNALDDADLEKNLVLDAQKRTAPRRR